MASIWVAFENMGMTGRHLDNFLAFLRSPILIIGAGHGLLAEHLKAKGHSVIAVDYSAEMARWAWLRRGVVSVVARAEALPMPSGFFGTVVVATGVLDSSDPSASLLCLKECRRVLNSEGVVLLGFPVVPSHALVVAEGIGYVVGMRQLWSRVVKLWNDRGNVERQVLSISTWTEVDSQEAAAVYVRNRETIENLVAFVDNVARTIALSGKDPVDFFCACGEFEIGLYSWSDVLDLLMASGLSVVVHCDDEEHWTGCLAAH
jgi:SAM-dependent methyltransferase